MFWLGCGVRTNDRKLAEWLTSNPVGRHASTGFMWVINGNSLWRWPVVIGAEKQD